MNIFAGIILCATLIASNGVHSQDCDTLQTDRCGELIWPFIVDTKLTPATEEEKEASCKQIREGEACTRDFLTRCPDVIKKENAEDLLESLNLTIIDFCGGPLGKRFLPYGACLQQNLGKNFTCNDEALVILEAAAVSEPVSERLKYACCSYLKFDKCFKDVSTNACGRRAARAIRNLVQSYAIFMVEKCIGFLAGPQRCDLTPLEKLNDAGSKRKPKTVFPALFDVIATTF